MSENVVSHARTLEVAIHENTVLRELLRAAANLLAGASAIYDPSRDTGPTNWWSVRNSLIQLVADNLQDETLRNVRMDRPTSYDGPAKPTDMRYLAREAIQVQDTCNLRGISRRFQQVVDAVAQQCAGSDELNAHPVIRLWTSKLHSLTGMGLSDVEPFGVAYDWCQAVADGGPE